MVEELEIEDVVEEFYNSDNLDDENAASTDFLDDEESKEEFDEEDVDNVQEIKSVVELKKYLDQELTIPEVSRTNSLEFEYENKIYMGIVMAKSKQYPNRYIFKIAPEWNLKAFWVDKITLI